MPMQSRMRTADNVRAKVIRQLQKKRATRCRLPHKLVHSPRRSMAQQHTLTIDVEPNVLGQRPQPSPILIRSIGQRVLVTDGREVIVARIGVPALTIVQRMTDRVIIVATQTPHVVLMQQRKYTIRMRPKRSHIAQAIHRFNPAQAGIRKSRLKGQPIRVKATKQSEFHSLNEMEFRS